MNLLVVAPSWIGDAVAAQPLLARLAERRPKPRIDLLAPAWVAPVLRRMPEVDSVIDNPFGHGVLDLRGRWRLARELARRRYDEAIVLPNSLKSALVPFLAGVPVRTGYLGEQRRGLLNRVHRLNPQALPQIAQRYAQLALAPGATPRAEPLQPRLTSTSAQQTATLATLGLQDDRAPLALCPGAEYGPAKRWPEAHYGALARALHGRGHAIWLLGSAKDRPVAQAIEHAAGVPCRNLCGGTDLGQAVDLLAASTFVVTNDSGLMHVAAALERPLVALFGSSDPRYTPPLSPQAQIVWLHLECSPCFARECPLGHLRCLTEIAPERVLASIATRLPAPH